MLDATEDKGREITNGEEPKDDSRHESYKAFVKTSQMRAQEYY